MCVPATQHAACGGAGLEGDGRLCTRSTPCLQCAANSAHGTGHIGFWQSTCRLPVRHARTHCVSTLYVPCCRQEQARHSPWQGTSGSMRTVASSRVQSIRFSGRWTRAWISCSKFRCVYVCKCVCVQYVAAGFDTRVDKLFQVHVCVCMCVCVCEMGSRVCMRAWMRAFLLHACVPAVPHSRTGCILAHSMPWRVVTPHTW